MSIVKPIYPAPSKRITLEDKLNEFNALLELNESMLLAYENVVVAYSHTGEADKATEVNSGLLCVHAMLHERIAAEFEDLFAFIMEQGGKR